MFYTGIYRDTMERGPRDRLFRMEGKIPGKARVELG